ncbi:MAG: amino acid ABC transporter permease [Polynucleobacter sp. 17-46-58]|jgi:polar amino acid transport system permease protein|nr:MAG: amino acid ABC transporter permease [Polynucleobacter sp. 17-46-58]HQR83340.1 amino acid ABC transporter permease [Polynucleobacter sp.]HQS60167.1 amino acid ABC transporter permease [Polynucleobacter sp.]HQT20385.1 amino acid ABC transporter permease [Polynucleobacter sp.]HQT40572.1 amino acid ABC transporter permease [Polynucleobacter sp.]
MGAWSSFTRDLLEQMPLILTGLVNTLQLAASISVSGLLLGILVFYLTLSKNKLVRNSINAYISFFIGMPLIVLLFLMYYGLPSWGIRLSPFTVAFIGFTFNVAAYNAAYLKTAYNGLDKSQLEAASAQGFNPLQIFQLITLPQVLRLSIPALTNQVIANLKDSSVAFLIQYTEFFARVQELAATNFQFFKAYFAAALVYLVLVSIIVLCARAIEKRYCIPA